jgi:hypothetical protein
MRAVLTLTLSRKERGQGGENWKFKRLWTNRAFGGANIPIVGVAVVCHATSSLSVISDTEFV